MIEARHLQKCFGEVTAVRDVSFTAKDAAVTGLLGPNGAGKTTTMRMLGTLVRPTSGTALADGIDLTAEPEAARRTLGILPDLRGLYPRFTAREQIRYFGELNGLSGNELEARIDELIRRLDLTAIADRRADGFSQGERTKVAIARALVHGPQNVLLDEPTNGLDVMSTRAMREIVRSLAGEGRCVVYTSHVMQEVAAVCDRIVILARGQVVAEGTADELRELAGTPGLEDAFVKIVAQAEQQQTPPETPASPEAERAENSAESSGNSST